MKITMATCALLSTLVPAFATDKQSTLTEEFLQQLAICQASSVSLTLLYTQIAASLELSPQNPQTVMLKDSYRAMAADASTKIRSITPVVTQTLEASGKRLDEDYMPLLSKTLVTIQNGLGAVEYEQQIAVQSLLLEQADVCDSFVNGINNRSKK